MEPGPMRIDARNLLCPLPVLALRKALAGLPPGAEVTLAATDPMARIDVPHFCAEAGHALVAIAEAGDVLSFTVRRGPRTGPRTGPPTGS